MSHAGKLQGLIAATHTPFNSQGELSLDCIERQAAHLLANEVQKVFIGGTTGESHSLSIQERMALAERWLQVTRGTPMQVIVHVGSNCLVDAQTLATQAEKLGAVAISALSPSYFKPRNVEMLVECMLDIAAAAPNTPFYFYDIPVLTGVQLSMPDFLALGKQKIPTLAGIKFTNPDLMAFQLCLHADSGPWQIPWGCDEYLLSALAVGARGAVGSTYNFAAPIYHRLWQRFHQEDLEPARVEQYRSVQLVQLLSRYGYMAAAKCVMGMLGVNVGPARKPHSNLTPQQAAQLRQELEQLGFFEWIKPS